ncbi:DUF3078 domain-containing protein [Urechidicola vernalis]|uniref:DUF3078 domain-containing protein n=1 Tax=Urechidicola vernalis TaxID=3075600 RepID=A0ABU2Y8C1_9FLAO|nr:DUF3078 domain-containing protein [Urechidicola sp. P050]MDT0553303.1 DUF3078 domain-containing protein [Urechidicola sp. P050]
MKQLFLIPLFLLCIVGNAQKDSIKVKDIETDSIYTIALKDLVKGFDEDIVEESIATWFRKNRLGLDISEVAFVNWNTGGTNSVSGLFSGEFERNFKKSYTVWNNRLVARIGLNNQADRGLRKTDDSFEFYSTFGYRKDTISNWYSSANLSFKTQLAPGYSYNGDERKLISNIMAPAYLFVGVGTIYSHDLHRFTAYISPLTLKSTFVLDQELANLGSFGVDPAIYDEDGNLIKEGKKTREEVGILLSSTFEREVFRNVMFRNIMSFYTDYINNFGNVDIDWELNFDFKVNDFIRAVFGSHIKYDDDVKITEKIDDEEVQVSGAKVQWKQLLGVGVVYDF